MKFNEIVFDEGRPVDGYGPNFFRIGGEVFKGAVAVLPNSCGTLETVKLQIPRQDSPLIDTPLLEYSLLN